MQNGIYESNPVSSTKVPEVALSQEIRFWTGFVIEQFFHKQVGRSLRESALRSIEKKIQSEGFAPILPTPFPEEQADALTKEEFIRKYIHTNIPVIIRGFGKSEKAIGKWSLDFFAQEYGHIRVPARLNSQDIVKSNLEGELVALKDLVGRIQAGEAIYGQNLQEIFQVCQELKSDIRSDIIHHFISTKKTSPKSSMQLFISNAKSRTAFHCATTVNIFTQVYGSKRWTMVDPYHSLFINMIPRKDTFYFQSPVDWNDSIEENQAKGFELYNCIPKYTGIIQPGDAILVPQWWWHAVDNLSDSIGVSVHSINDFYKGHYIFPILTLFSLTIWHNIYDILTNGSGTDKSLADRVFTMKKK